VPAIDINVRATKVGENYQPARSMQQAVNVNPRKNYHYQHESNDKKDRVFYIAEQVF
jgi:hypothetical protein